MSEWRRGGRRPGGHPLGNDRFQHHGRRHADVDPNGTSQPVGPLTLDTGGVALRVGPSRPPPTNSTMARFRADLSGPGGLTRYRRHGGSFRRRSLQRRHRDERRHLGPCQRYERLGTGQRQPHAQRRHIDHRAAGVGSVSGTVRYGTGPGVIAPGNNQNAYGNLMVGGLSTSSATTLHFDLGSPLSNGTYGGDLITVNSRARSRSVRIPRSRSPRCPLRRATIACWPTATVAR